MPNRERVRISPGSITLRDSNSKFMTPIQTGSYERTMREVDKTEGVIRPSASQVLQLAYGACQLPREAHSKKILSAFKNMGLFTSTEAYVLPKGKYFYDNPNGDKKPQRNELEIETESGNIRFTPEDGGPIKISELEDSLLDPLLGDEEGIEYVRRLVEHLGTQRVVFSIEGGVKNTYSGSRAHTKIGTN